LCIFNCEENKEAFMQLKKLSLAAVAALSLTFFACGGDSSSGSTEGGSSSSSSSSYSQPVDLPTVSGDSAITISNFKTVPVTQTSIKLTGTVSVSEVADSTVYLDSVSIKLATSDGYLMNDVKFSMNPIAYSNRQTLNITNELSPVLDLTSFNTCGSYKVYLIVYATNKIVKTDSTTFSKSESLCATEESSSSSSESVKIAMTTQTVTLSTKTSATASGIDLDNMVPYTSDALQSNAASIDLYVSRENGEAILFTGKELGATSYAKIGEEESGYNAGEVPNPVYTSDFSYNAGNLTYYADDVSYGNFYVVVTPEYDAATGKGFFVIMTNPSTADSDVSVELTVWGVWN